MTYELYLPSTDDVCRYLGMIRGEDLIPPGTLHMLVADFHGFSTTAIFIDDVPDTTPPADSLLVLENSLAALAQAITVHGVALAVSRSGEPETTGSDLVWRDAFGAAAAAANTTNHGVYVVTESRVSRLGGPSSLAA